MRLNYVVVGEPSAGRITAGIAAGLQTNADDRMIWVVAKSRGQSPDRLWHAPEDGPFRIEAGLFSGRWMREATEAEVIEPRANRPSRRAVPRIWPPCPTTSCARITKRSWARSPITQ